MRVSVLVSATGRFDKWLGQSVDQHPCPLPWLLHSCTHHAAPWVVKGVLADVS